jgi:hypothetical protein
MQNEISFPDSDIDVDDHKDLTGHKLVEKIMMNVSSTENGDIGIIIKVLLVHPMF